MEALTPPAQLSEWHLLSIEGNRTIQALIDIQPKDDVVDIAFFFLIVAVSANLQEKSSEAAARLPEDVRQQMIEAGCIEPENAPEDHGNDFESATPAPTAAPFESATPAPTAAPTMPEYAPDDHGDDFESATRIAIGEAAEIELENLDEIDVFVFRAGPGAEYVITLDWETYEMWDNPGSIMALYDAGGQVLASLDDYDFSSNRSQNNIMWQAVTGGDYYIVVGDQNTVGTFTLTVTRGEATEPIATPAPTQPPTPAGEFLRLRQRR